MLLVPLRTHLGLVVFFLSLPPSPLTMEGPVRTSTSCLAAWEEWPFWGRSGVSSKVSLLFWMRVHVLPTEAARIWSREAAAH